ncbi:hypothetical protein XEUV354_03145 [Xanthomonas euvesicatoria]|nr:hypothetical protein XEUV354_03145 [Xanthomonas euvesicatoria]KLB69677.1 hypothetical protein XEUV490_14720 [Xanthomonas euvesicatoria]KLB85197.1 hypothetical protein XEUV526_10915 [Xanthomonas euvesicatoria]KLB98570.1 hypothetical protein XEUV678_04765 [Xanthomonas euvesicatoria]OCG90719.1 hypothetical protein LMG667_01600 [Xanthomonas euvesicatoria]
MHAQRLGETVDVQQGNVALPTLDAAKVAARQPALQGKTFLGESLGLTDLGKSQPKQDAGIGGHRFLWHERTMQLQPLSGHAL